MTSKTTDSTGKCTFSNIINGTYSLSVSKTDYNNFTETITINNNDIDKNISLEKTPVCIIEVDATLGSTFATSTLSSGIYMRDNNSVDYGDGTVEQLSTGYHRLNHTYSDSTKTYNITITNTSGMNPYCYFGVGNMVGFTMPYKMSYVPYNFFMNCGNLKFVKFLTNTISLEHDAFTGVPSSCIIYCPTGCKTDYETVFTEAGYSFTVTEYEV